MQEALQFFSDIKIENFPKDLNFSGLRQEVSASFNPLTITIDKSIQFQRIGQYKLCTNSEDELKKSFEKYKKRYDLQINFSPQLDSSVSEKDFEKNNKIFINEAFQVNLKVFNSNLSRESYLYILKADEK